MANFISKLLQNFKQLECEFFRILLKHVSDHLLVLFSFCMTVPLSRFSKFHFSFNDFGLGRLLLVLVRNTDCLKLFLENKDIFMSIVKKKLFLEAIVPRCSVKGCPQKFRKIHRKTPVPEVSFLENSQETTCARVSILIKLMQLY